MTALAVIFLSISITKNPRGSGTPLIRLYMYKDNELFLGHLQQSAHLTNFGRLQNSYQGKQDTAVRCKDVGSHSTCQQQVYPIGNLLWKVSQILDLKYRSAKSGNTVSFFYNNQAILGVQQKNFGLRNRVGLPYSWTKVNMLSADPLWSQDTFFDRH